jgi:Ca2+-binding RTX toxin-like protein
MTDAPTETLAQMYARQAQEDTARMDATSALSRFHEANASGMLSALAPYVPPVLEKARQYTVDEMPFVSKSPISHVIETPIYTPTYSAQVVKTQPLAVTSTPSQSVNITTNFSSLANLNDARTAVLSTSLPLITAINYSHQAYNNAFTYSYSTYDTRSSSKVTGTLTNGDYGVAYGSSLTAYPSTLTQGDYTFVDSNVAVTFYGTVSQANAYAYKTGYLNKIIVSSGQAQVTMNGYVGVSANNGGTISDFTVQNGQALLVGVGDFAIQGSGSVYSGYQSSISGTLSSVTLSSGSNSITISGSIDIKSLSSYSSFTDFLAAIMSKDDNVTGTNASEYLIGYAGNDNLNAGYGDDTLDGGTGNDILDGGFGTNTAVYSSYKSSFSVSKSGETYSISSTSDGTDTLSNIQYLQFADGLVAIDSALPAPAPVVQPVVTTTPITLIVTPPTSLIIKGTSSNDFLIGTDSDNKILGMAGDDTLTGGLGNDTLNGGAGKDLLVGGTGADVFAFNIDSKNTIDTFSDFSHQEGDKIDLSIIDADTAKTGDQAFAKLDVGATFTGKFTKSGQLFFETSTHILWGNVDNKAGADFSLQLNGVSGLVVGDFVF